MIIRNSAECLTCDVKLESTHRHDFKQHVCPNSFRAAQEWYKDEDGKDKLRDASPRVATYNWFIDGGKEYIRQGGSGFRDTSIFA